MDLYAVTSQQVLERISRHCPDAMAIYIHCLNRADDTGNIFFTKEKITVDMSLDMRSFTAKIKKLALEDLLEWHPFHNGIAITLANVCDDDV